MATVAGTTSDLEAKRELLAQHEDLFKAEIAAIDAQLVAAEFEAEVAQILMEAGVGRITSFKADAEGNYSFRTLKGVNEGGTSASSAHGNWPYNRIVYNGKEYNTWSSLCNELNMDFGSDSARRYLAAHNSAVYEQVRAESQ